MRQIEGLTEYEVTRIIEQVVFCLSPKLVFGFHTTDDIYQEGWVIAIEGLNHFDHECNPSQPIAKALENFLRVHVNNRLKNFKRNQVGRIEKPTNPAKLESWEKKLSERQNLLYPIDIHALTFDLPVQNTNSQNIEYQELIDKINKDLPVWLRSDFLRMVDGVKIPAPRQRKVREAVSMILQSVGYINGKTQEQD